MEVKKVFLALVISGLAMAQRGSYAGIRPIGYPAITTSTIAVPLSDRFGNDNSTTSTTTSRLPPEALGDRELVDRLSKLPKDKQPFWLLNWQALEDNRNNPQSYEPNHNSFVDRFASMPGQSVGVSTVSLNSRGSESSQRSIDPESVYDSKEKPALSKTNQAFNKSTSKDKHSAANVNGNRRFNSAGNNWQQNPNGSG